MNYQPDKNYNIGLVVSSFDLLHSGHMLLLKDAKEKCNILFVGLHTDPTLDRKEKNKPILSVEERLILLEGIRYVDYIFTYNTEAELHTKIRSIDPDLLILGSDWKDKEYNGKDLDIDVYFHDRTVHNYSTTNLRKRVWRAENENANKKHT
jgi:glycerol-3-phosphate cytidylyltransferase